MALFLIGVLVAVDWVVVDEVRAVLGPVVVLDDASVVLGPVVLDEVVVVRVVVLGGTQPKFLCSAGKSSAKTK